MLGELVIRYRNRSMRKMDEADASILKMKGATSFNERSRERGNVDLGNDTLDRLPLDKKVSMMTRVLPNIRRCLKAHSVSIDSLERNPVEPKAIADVGFFAALEAEAKRLGASAVGYAVVPREYIFKDKGILFRNAIVLTMEMDREAMGKAPSLDTLNNVIETYADLGEIANAVAAFLRKNGYGAHASPALGGVAMYPALAEDAGLGVRGRHGLLISPGNGPRQRLAAVFTSIENLPATEGNPHAWVRDFCGHCGVCIKKCPPGAIYEAPLKLESGERRYVDAGKCLPYFGGNYGCSICIKECPFNRIGYEKIAEKKEI
jgi:ferredoxin